ncbi:hypothetical protein AGMMS49992_11840 [Clostridia bacterium]|nr:hypothetical protein AGMMS49992_11840 [Clostridia bacterium]
MKQDLSCYHSGLYGCDALEDGYRCGANCAFHLTLESRMASILKANRRLCSLPEELQEHISLKYYSGIRPWLPLIRGLK